MPSFWLVDFDYPKIQIHLDNKTFITKEGFGKAPSIYPVTVVQARYNGTYEGSAWLCFPVHPHVMMARPWDGWDDSDIECMEFWRRAAEENWPVGHGGNPSLAYADLVARVCEKAGLDAQELYREPTWDRDELGKQMEEDGINP